MSKLRIDPLVAIARYYKEEIDPTTPLYQMKEQYYKIVPIQFIDDGNSRITAVIEAPTIPEFYELKRVLKDMGVLSMEWRHNDKREFVKL